MSCFIQIKLVPTNINYSTKLKSLGVYEVIGGANVKKFSIIINFIHTLYNILTFF